MKKEEILSKLAAKEITVEEAVKLLEGATAKKRVPPRNDVKASSRTDTGTPIDNMIEALGIEIEAIKKNTRSSVLELRGGIKQGNTVPAL